MRASRAAMVAGGCAAIVGAGWAASPKELPTLDLVAASTPEESASPSVAVTPDAGASPSPSAVDEVDEDDDEYDDHDDDDAGDDKGGERDDDESDDVATPAPAATTAQPDPVVTPPPAEEPATPVAQTFDGPVVTNARGDFQARITVEGGVVTNVQAVAAGTQDAQSVQINANAIPILRDEMLAAQSWDVAAVSGASFTSPGFIESARGAFGQAGL
ncbi:FMN-binding protein [Demequina subtropica]|uniref:FMN-binding protein n=1 Tax=Demequina subtropica TaxID=1638989 RepID=UPI0007836436|nr:hypothetical protein [Demequina subtropica]